MTTPSKKFAMPPLYEKAGACVGRVPLCREMSFRQHGAFFGCYDQHVNDLQDCKMAVGSRWKYSVKDFGIFKRI
jgi:hypothetical protein